MSKEHPHFFPTESTPQNTTKKMKKTDSILELMEFLANEAQASGLTDEFFNKVNDESTWLGNRLKLTPMEAVFYSVFINHYDDTNFDLSDLRHFTRSSMIRLAKLQDSIETLVKRRLIEPTTNSHSSTTSYHVPKGTMNALRRNQPFKPEKREKLSHGKFMDELNKLVSARHSDAISYETMRDEINLLMHLNDHLLIVSDLNDLRRDDNYDRLEWMLFVVMCTVEHSHGGEFGLNHLRRIFHPEDADRLRQRIETESLNLQSKGWICFAEHDGLVDRDTICMGELDFAEFPSKILYMDTPNQVTLDTIKPSSIKTKKLFYTPDVEKQVDRLYDLLSKKSFNKICDRLRKNNMRPGFTCLFYGTPGTGKTETVKQLAKKTGRAIYEVNFSEIKDKYVGESEKNLKAVFDNYYALRASHDLCPILLFNEADAIIGKRLEHVERSVDNMYNTMQNILLQELEDFEGIFIATTNLEQNMDSAFERRFLYKVQFEKPTAEVRQRIWKSIIPTLSEATALSLAQEHEFSGGQIENIARKMLVDNILYGDKANQYQALKEYCNSELLQSNASHRQVGFKR